MFFLLLSLAVAQEKTARFDDPASKQLIPTKGAESIDSFLDCSILFMVVANGRSTGASYLAASEVLLRHFLFVFQKMKKVWKYNGASFVSVQQFSSPTPSAGIFRIKFVSFNLTMSQVSFVIS